MAEQPENGAEVSTNTGAKVYILTVFLLALLFAAATAYLQIQNEGRIAKLVRRTNWFQETTDGSDRFRVVDDSGTPVPAVRDETDTRVRQWPLNYEAGADLVAAEQVHAIDQVEKLVRDYVRVKDIEHMDVRRHMAEIDGRLENIALFGTSEGNDSRRRIIDASTGYRFPRKDVRPSRSQRFAEHMVTAEFHRQRNTGGIQRKRFSTFLTTVVAENPFLTLRDFLISRKDGEGGINSDDVWHAEATFVWYTKNPNARKKRN